MIWLPLQQSIEDTLRDALNDAIAFTPRLLGALLVLLLGLIIGRILGGVVERLVRASGLDRRVFETRVGVLFDDEHGFSWAVGKITAYYIYLIALLAAADVLGVAVLSEWLDTAVSFLPALIAGLLIIFLGFILADLIAKLIRESPTSRRTGFAPIIATGVQLFLYFVVLTMGLGTMGVDISILLVVLSGFVGALGLALALGVGLAIGLGGKEYVAEHIDGWVSGVDESIAESEE